MAELLDTTVASVNSALQRARATLAARGSRHRGPLRADGRRAEGAAGPIRRAPSPRYDIDALVALLHEDATASMPPFQLWLQGSDDIGKWHVGPGSTCEHSTLVPIEVNGSPAYAHYRPGPDG